MNNLLTLKFWFNLRPTQLMPFAKYALIALIAILILLAIITAIKKTKGSIYKKTLRRLYNFGSVNAIIGLLLLFFDYEQAPFFSSRFWLGLWFIGMVIWIAYILKGLKSIPLRKEELEKQAQFKKYLP